jgi:hypothetical protein
MKSTSSHGLRSWLIGAATGALLMYLLDPQQGRRRIALGRDRMTHWGKRAADGISVGMRDLGHRAQGLVAEATRGIEQRAPSDAVLVQRVRAALGRVVSHPHALQVSADAGRVCVSGPILEQEQKQLLDVVRSVSGVRDVESQLSSYASADGVPALQGGRLRTGPRSELLQHNWAPGPRLLATAGGLALVARGRGRRGLSGSLLRAAGMTLVARALANPLGTTKPRSTQQGEQHGAM